ncbi:MAG: cell division/cell wall cluster transcriptional repressor MraZ [Spirochaetes bacterium GWD1_61_31]|nr:MAG: cell division/cell wall cluster transcriptional repressor MraZ [Spirochaetes bacterium GWB1_60_80]OHD34722.1 MAG: cell division/cell wall cluster transcriptional repressor MraZ [Spirochaetes bacterium GWC1_61_12]OHD38744.1 MAG: cell division/cell wall cluster transcriptional repressor MraZ [Spirochaetes bacterium GWD1_61_31]OHD44489.1 MAG: cell division/cell wall cluster transcriptional repressor MraZ [Spirochaetes bacterium GWE1_60_18]OHD59361.1 MAG: cell division/cell wall cluster tra
MDLLTGEFKNTLDDKGRLSLPAKLRNGLAGNVLVVTRGIDKCLWVFTPERWTALSDQVFSNTSLFQQQSRIVQLRIIAPAQEVEIDKAGRIAVPQSLREYAGLTKDCVVLGVTKRLEIWDLEAYKAWLDATEADFTAASEALNIQNF